MARDACDRYARSQAVLREAEKRLGRSLAAVMFGDDAESLGMPENAQVALATAECCLLAALQEEGFAYDTVLGHSLGEWPALVAADCIDFGDMIELVDLRARAMASAVGVGEGKMCAVLGLDLGVVERTCAAVDGVWPANLNSSEQIVVSGLTASVDKACAALSDAGGAVVALAVGSPSHCPLMGSAAKRVEEALSHIRFRAPSVPIVMNATGAAERDVAIIKANMVEQMTKPVRFSECVGTAVGMGVTDFVEVGPGSVLSKLVRKNARGVSRHSACDAASVSKTMEMLTEGEDA